MTQPIKPKDVVSAKQESLPDQVIEAFNELIAENWKGSSAKIRQDDALKGIRKKFTPKRVTSQTILDNNWLDIEEVYRKAGWDVYYDNPAYNETYEPTFEFSKKSKR